jgi:hypothetical protein
VTNARRCQVAAQVVLGGRQDTAVRAYCHKDGWRPAYLSVRVGRFLLNIEDRRALEDLAGVVGHAVTLADRTFGPPPHPLQQPTATALTPPGKTAP